ncbi:hypothetical protein [Bradyrhizobium sp. BWA-3-5]|uniref:hypothetical protein n=1 Tax=Bradyrhizobium sp. BWA-3-5 TaxID=3080013 RepID=UPI00293E8304|nr:hypothetical protein [Bradyrhizobium sp. BWA-3-5]WOH68167.1 hypothetical protein RX331_10800 [Bradyrhizobium sp. BWA-3-5]
MFFFEATCKAHCRNCDPSSSAAGVGRKFAAGPRLARIRRADYFSTVVASACSTQLLTRARIASAAAWRRASAGRHRPDPSLVTVPTKWFNG